METKWGVGLISIIGMHRSGTSALAGALHKLGADFGPEGSWVQPATDNPRGFFEYAPLVDLNRGVLAALGGTWSSPPPTPRGWVRDERLTEIRSRMEQLAAEMPERMVVKDPRLSLVQPLWEDVGAVQGSIVCLRHPAAVARSLQKRNGFTIDEGLFLWFRYSTAALLNCPDALLIEYESLLGDPAPNLIRIAEHIALDVSNEMVEAAAGTIYREMAHHEGTELPDSPIGIMCGQLYETVRSSVGPGTDEPIWLWARLITELPWAGPGDREIRRIGGELAGLRSEISRLTEFNTRQERRLRRIESELRYALDMVDLASITGVHDLSSSKVSEER